MSGIAAKAKEQAPQQETVRSLNDATTEIVKRVEARAQKTLLANPFSKEIDENEEAGWRELARAIRQLHPLFDAFGKACEPDSETAKYRDGFYFRLWEAIDTITELTEYERLHYLHQRRRGCRRKKRSLDPLDFLIVEGLRTGRRAEEIWRWIVDKKIDVTDDLNFEDGKIVVYDDDDRGHAKRRIGHESFPSIISQLKKRLAT